MAVTAATRLGNTPAHAPPVRHLQRDAKGAPVRDEWLQARLLPGRADPLIRADELRRCRVLGVRRDAGLGDCIMITPALRALRKAEPHLWVHFFVPGPYCDLFHGLAYLDGVSPLEDLAVERFDRVVDLSNYVERHAFAWSADRIELFGRGLGVEIDDGTPDCVIRPQARAWADAWLRERHGVTDGTHLIGVALRGNFPHRSWPRRHVEAFTAVATDAGLACVVFDRDERALVNGRQVINACGLALDRVAALVERCDVIVTPDTGLLHLAAALGTPFVGIYGPVPPELRAAHYRNHRILLSALPCVPCRESGPDFGEDRCGYACMAAVQPHEVWETALELIAQGPSGSE